MKKVHRIIRFNQKAWLKSCIGMNLELRKKSKNYFDKDNNSVFGKTIENIQKRRDIKLVKTERRRNYLVSEQNYHTSSSLSSLQ